MHLQARNAAIVGSALNGGIILCGALMLLLNDHATLLDIRGRRKATVWRAAFFSFSICYWPTLLFLGAVVPWVGAVYDSLATSIVFTAVPPSLGLVVWLLWTFLEDVNELGAAADPDDGDDVYAMRTDASGYFVHEPWHRRSTSVSFYRGLPPQQQQQQLRQLSPQPSWRHRPGPALSLPRTPLELTTPPPLPRQEVRDTAAAWSPASALGRSPLSPSVPADYWLQPAHDVASTPVASSGRPSRAVSPRRRLQLDLGEAPVLYDNEAAPVRRTVSYFLDVPFEAELQADHLES